MEYVNKSVEDSYIFREIVYHKKLDKEKDMLVFKVVLVNLIALVWMVISILYFYSLFPRTISAAKRVKLTAVIGLPCGILLLLVGFHLGGVIK